LQSIVVFAVDAAKALPMVADAQVLKVNEVGLGSVTSAWTNAHVAAITDQALPRIPLIGAADAAPILPGHDLWDMWPVQLADGSVAAFGKINLWCVLSAPVGDDPGNRHNIARIRLIQHDGHNWIDCGNMLPDGFSPGSREWAGSACFDPATQYLTLYFTAAGRRGTEQPTFDQRLFETRGSLSFVDGCATITKWSPLIESVVSDAHHYVRVDQAEGEPGHIKAFRDPAFFRDPKDGKHYLLFTGSLAGSASAYNGAVGVACQEGGTWRLLPPLVHADGLNNELERPHIIARGGLYYLFWSTQHRVFAPDGPSGPNGLYGMVAPSLFGPYQPLNSTGLVAANPEEEPLQAYSWWVLDSFEVISFVDHWGLQGRRFEEHPELLRTQFGGTPAPRFSIKLDGQTAVIAA
jgi:levansucrase